MTNQKRIREWFIELPEPYQTQVIDNTDLDVLQTFVSSIDHALIVAFPWAHTQQGYEYWDNFRNTL